MIFLKLILFLLPTTYYLLPSTASAQVTLTAVGDIRLDYSYRPEKSLQDILIQSDLAFGNLECVVAEGGEKVQKKWNIIAPPSSLKWFLQQGFDVLNVANNHTMDYGASALERTLGLLSESGFIYVGAGRNRRQAEELKLVIFPGIRIGFLGFTSTFPQEAWADSQRPGVAYSDFERAPVLIQKAKKQVDILIVSFHGGTELATEPNQVQREFAHLAIHAGADLFLGHHPHVLQPVEMYEGKPILYSLGNFFFVSPNPATHDTAIVKIELAHEGIKKVSFVPVQIRWGDLQVASLSRREEIRKKLNLWGTLDRYPEVFSIE